MRVHLPFPMVFSFRRGVRLCIVIAFLSACIQTETADAQAISSVRAGNWNDPAVWDGAIVPTDQNSSSVIVDHHVVVPGGVSVTIDNLEVRKTLEIAASAECRLSNGSGDDLVIAAGGELQVHGSWVSLDGSLMAGTSTAVTIFHAGSVYRHEDLGEGTVPQALWHEGSTFELGGLEGNVTLQSPLWGQSFGNFVYDCPAQGQFVEFKGLLRDIRGDLIIRNTNRSVLRLAQSQDLNLTVAGDVIIEGPSEVWFGMSGTSAIDIGGDFVFTSTSTASSYFTTTGITTCSIAGNFHIDAVHRLKMASSTASGNTHIEIGGDVTIVNGVLDALGSGSGTIELAGPAPQEISIEEGSSGIDGNVSFVIGENATVDMGSSCLTGAGSLAVSGVLRLGSSDPGGVIQDGGGGNVSLSGVISFHEGSEVWLDGIHQQTISNGNFGSSSVKMLNEAGVVLAGDVQFHHLEVLDGALSAADYAIGVSGSMRCTADLDSHGVVRLNGNDQQVLDLNGATLNILEIDNEGSVISLMSATEVRGRVSIASVGTTLQTNDHLTLLSVDAGPFGSASIDRLPPGSAITGNVTIQRFMASIDGGYRYISAPVVGATVASLMDDNPVTGSFDNPSSGEGLPSSEPSLFYFDSNQGVWMAYPTEGLAENNPLSIGKGYSFYDYNNDAGTVWDVSGEIFQGPLNYELFFTETGDEETAGWNLIGNPYPSAIAWGGEGWNFNESISAGIAVRDNELGGFRYWDGATGNLPGGRIAMGQSFWVHANAADPVLVIDEQAKSTDGGNFFRTREPDVVELIARSAGWEDHTYLRLRAGASTRSDPFDVPKLPNDNLSISVVVDDARSMAISAVGTIPCTFTVPVNVEIADDTWAEIDFSVRTAGAFSVARVSLIDSVTGNSYPLTDGPVVSMPLDQLIRSKLYLAIESWPPAHIVVDAPREVCDGDSLEVAVTGNAGNNHIFISTETGEWDPARRKHNTLVFSPAITSAGENHLAVWSYSACGERVFVDSLLVEQREVSAPVARGGFACGEGTVVLQGTKTMDRSELWWYDEITRQRVGRGEIFETPPLRESRQYHVIQRSNRCESQPVTVEAEIYPSAMADLAFHDGELVTSSDGLYRWFLDGLSIPWEESSMPISQPGRYTLVVTAGMCSATSSFDYLVTGIDDEPATRMVFPNPCDDSLVFPIRDDEIIWEVRISGNRGEATRPAYFCHDNNCIVNTASLAPGIYVLTIRSDVGIRISRFIRR